MASINSKISFTIDIWTSLNNKFFIAAIAHYIDDDWNIRGLLVDFSLISGRHDGANIADRFFNVLTDYKIVSKVWRTLIFLHCYFSNSFFNSYMQSSLRMLQITTHLCAS